MVHKAKRKNNLTAFLYSYPFPVCWLFMAFLTRIDWLGPRCCAHVLAEEGPLFKGGWPPGVVWFSTHTWSELGAEAWHARLPAQCSSPWNVPTPCGGVLSWKVRASFYTQWHGELGANFQFLASLYRHWQTCLDSGLKLHCLSSPSISPPASLGTGEAEANNRYKSWPKKKWLSL